jgi:hypothetical protein
MDADRMRELEALLTRAVDLADVERMRRLVPELLAYTRKQAAVIKAAGDTLSSAIDAPHVSEYDKAACRLAVFNMHVAAAEADRARKDGPDGC